MVDRIEHGRETCLKPGNVVSTFQYQISGILYRFAKLFNVA
jgi:hypothetical protein